MNIKLGLGLLLFLLLYIPVFSQNTSNYQINWHFGDNSGISFSSGVPVNIPSNITSEEAISCYSDGFGNSIMYCSADTIWDASDMPMPNGQGLIGDFSSSCGSMIAPVPGNCDQYYMFYNTSHGTGWGLAYSLIDLTLPGNGTVGAPLGDVVPGQKDIMHYSGDNLAEKILFVQKGNTENYWVIMRSITQDVFYSFEVTNTGINPVPVTSVVSATVWPGVVGSPLLGWIGVNKQRNMIVEANGVLIDAKIFDFDNQTGIVSNEEVLLTGLAFPSDLAYGISFSPSGEKLHVGWTRSVPAGYFISSFDVTGGVGTVAATRIDHDITAQFSMPGPDIPRAIVKAPDGKVYFTRDGPTAPNSIMGAINDPENIVVPNINASAYIAGGVANLGLPNFSYYFHPDNYIDTLAGNDRDICNNDQVEVGALGYDSIWVNYIWEPAGMLAGSPNEATPLTMPLTADQQYIVHLVTACGDTVNTDTTMVLVNPLDASVTSNSPICENQTLSLNGTPTGLGAGNYQWVGPNGPFGGVGLSNVSITPFPNPIPGGYFYLTVTDGLCSDTDSILVVSNPTYNITIDSNVCEGVTYIYPDGSTSVITGNESNTSNLLTTEGCDSTIVTNITMIPSNLINSITTMNISSCLIPDGSLTVNATGASNYELFSDDGVSIISNASGVFNGLAADGYYVVATNAGGCTDTSTIEFINDPPGPVFTSAIATDEISCLIPDGTMTVTATSAASFELFNDDNVSIATNATGIFNGLSADGYYVVAIDAGGCDDTSSIEIVNSPVLPAAPSSGAIITYCDTDVLQDMIVTGSGGTITWYSDPALQNVLATGASYTPSTSLGTTYYYVTEILNGCESDTATFEITINVCCDLGVSAFVNDETCDGADDGAVDFTISGSGTYNILIDNNPEFTNVIAGSQSWIGQPDGTYNVQVVDANDPNCDTNFMITINQGITVPITSEVATGVTNCQNPNGAITIVSGGDSYELFDDQGVSQEINITGVFTNLDIGDYYVEVSDGACSTTSSIVSVLDETQPSVNTIDVDVCEGTTYTFADSTTQVINSDTTYVSTLINATGCDSIITENITMLVSPSRTITDTICEGDNYSSQYSGQYVNVLQSFTATTIVGAVAPAICDSIIIENIIVTPAPEIDFGNDIVICEGESVTITVSTNTGNIPIWSTGDTITSTTFTATTDTMFVASDSVLCGQVSDTIYITVNTAPIIDAGPDVTIPLGATADLGVTSSDPSVYFQWTPITGLTCTNCSDPVAYVTNDVMYIVSGTDENGCTGYDTVNVILKGEIMVYIPNVFSPNNDGENDLFQVYGPEWSEYKMQIFDRFGTKIFETEDENEHWNGNHYKNGEPCPQQVFVYKFKATSAVGQLIERAGTVMLAR